MLSDLSRTLLGGSSASFPYKIVYLHFGYSTVPMLMPVLFLTSPCLPVLSLGKRIAQLDLLSSLEMWVFGFRTAYIRRAMGFTGRNVKRGGCVKGCCNK